MTAATPVQIALGPEFTIAAAAFVSMTITRIPQASKILQPLIVLFALSLSLVQATKQIGQSPIMIGNMYILNEFTTYHKVMLLTVALFFTMYLGRGDDKRHIKESGVLLLIAIAGLLLILGSIDAISTFVGLEIVIYSLYLRIRNHRGDLKTDRNLFWKVQLAGSALILASIVVLVGITGSTHFSNILSRLDGSSGNSLSLIHAACLLYLLGILMKSGFIPFHGWMIRLQRALNFEESLFFMMMATVAGAATCSRFLILMPWGSKPVWLSVFLGYGIFTMTVGHAIALMAKRGLDAVYMLFFSQQGFILAGLGLMIDFIPKQGQIGGLGASLMNLAGFTLVCVGITSAYAFHEMGHRISGALMLFFLMTLCGFPTTLGFIDKFQLLSSAYLSPHPALTGIILLNMAFGFVISLRFAYGETSAVKVADSPGTPAVRRMAAFSTMAILLYFGIFPDYLDQWIRTISRFTW